MVRATHHPSTSCNSASSPSFSLNFRVFFIIYRRRHIFREAATSAVRLQSHVHRRRLDSTRLHPQSRSGGGIAQDSLEWPTTVAVGEIVNCKYNSPLFPGLALKSYNNLHAPKRRMAVAYGNRFRHLGQNDDDSLLPQIYPLASKILNLLKIYCPFLFPR